METNAVFGEDDHDAASGSDSRALREPSRDFVSARQDVAEHRRATRNAHGWSHFSQPSAPLSTTVAAKLLGAAKPVSNVRAESKARGDWDAEDSEEEGDAKLYIAGDFPPQVKPYAPSFGSGRTPRFDTKELNLDVCPRTLAIDDHNDNAEAKRYRTLQPRADRDDELVHGEQMESAYATHFQHFCEPELTFSSAKFQGTVECIFYSSDQLASFQLLYLPTADCRRTRRAR